MFKTILDTLIYVARSWADWTFRQRKPGIILVNCAVALLALLLAGVVFKADTKWGRVSFSTAAETPNWLLIAAFAVVVILLLVGLYLTLQDVRTMNRKRVFVVELRGLRDMSGCPLAKEVSSRIVGRREQVLVNLRQGQDGAITNPQAALRKVMALPTDLASREAGHDRDDFTYVFGGLASVPLTLLAGVLTDDECAVTLMDWNRHRNCWSELNESDDGKRFVETGLNAVSAGAAEVVMAVTVSYQVDLNRVAQKVPGMPLVELRLDGAGTDAHWSEVKQIALGKQFLDTLIDLQNRGVATVHLFLAAPSSMVLRLGRLYDIRNLPALIVYQFEPNGPPFPWGVKMPVQGNPDAQIV